MKTARNIVLALFGGALALAGCAIIKPVGIIYPPKRAAVEQPATGITMVEMRSEVLPDPTLPASTVTVIQRQPGEWIWQVVAGNNQLLDESHRTFESPSAALRHYSATRAAMGEQPAPVVIRDHILAPEEP